MIPAALVILMIVIVGCAYMSHIVTTKDQAYVIGRAAVIAYQASDGKVPEVYRSALAKVWQAFDENFEEIVTTKVDQIPELLKAKTGNNDKINTVIDTVWAKVTAKIDLKALDSVEFRDTLTGLHDGIAAGIASIQ